MTIPGSAEIMWGERFFGCRLSELVFELPSHLAKLSLAIPAELVVETTDVPDSVSEVELFFDEEYSKRTVLNFGRESRIDAVGITGGSSVPVTRVFARVPESFVKGVRLFVEFSDEDWRRWG